MLRITTSSIALLLALGCSTPSPTGIDAGDDASTTPTEDMGTTPTEDTGTTPTEDGGLCTAEPLTATCSYRGYGTTCPVPCDLPADCTFDVVVTWTGGYCCGGGSGTGSESYTCHCEGGMVLCGPPFGPPMGAPPTTTCEFCEPRDAGTDTN